MIGDLILEILKKYFFCLEKEQRAKTATKE